MKLNIKWLALCITIIAYGCVKKETVFIERPNTCFEVTPWIDYYLHVDRDIPTSIVDSAFMFSNCTTSKDSVTYQWNFGDGTFSNEYSPMHRYAKRGTYAVTLVVLRKAKPIDSLTQTVNVILGQKEYSFSQQADYALDMAATSDDGYIMLGKSDWASGYYIIKTDSLLKQTLTKLFPVQSHNLSSIMPLADGNYILAGSTAGADQQIALTKIDEDGSVIWSKAYSGTNGTNSHAVQTNDGHIITIGTEFVADQNANMVPRMMVIKTDNDGNVVWEKRFSDADQSFGARDIIAEDDGYVFAANKRSAGGGCYDCDSLQIMKIAKTDGAVMWKNTVMWGFNGNVWDVRLKKIDGQYKAANMNSSVVFSFNQAGSFVDRNGFELVSTTKNLGETADGGMLVLIEEAGNGFSSRMVKANKNGAELWRSQLNGVQYFPGGYSCCANTTPVKSLMLNNGGNVILAMKNDNDPVYNYRSKIVLLQIDENGFWK